MDKVFIYWDNSNISHEAQRFAEEQNEGPDARWRVRIDFEKMLQLAHADRPLAKAVAAGSVPPELRYLWNRLESPEVEVKLFDRGASDRGEQDVPDRMLQLRMLEDGLDYNGDPGIIVLLTGDGAGYIDGAGFHSTLTRLHKKGWRIEVLSWIHSCNKKMKQWAEEHGVFVPLDDFYEAITFRAPSREGHEFARSRNSVPLNLDRRERV
ncbi:NYN domain-containing protein [Candidatus Spongiihabitans sp.]|uniref:NYN domain-containing protein n=1 Tax=Candidatus Spongiihabitans sp. TaxID=3101308 RepID=UPI003C7B8D35